MEFLTYKEETMFSFKPLSDEEINAINNRDLLPDGLYPFSVKSAELHHSEQGNVSFKVTLLVYYAEKNEKRYVTDYLSTSEVMMFKLKHFCESIGIENKYKEGNISGIDCIDREGVVKIGTQKGGAKKDGTGFYNDKNVVKDYCLSSASSKPLNKEFNDEISF